MRKISVAVTGRIPSDLHVFRCALTPFLNDRATFPDVVLSTWEGELSDELRAEMKAKGVRVVEFAPPVGFDVPGYRFHQSKSLLAALRHIDPDRWVLKTRPDLLLLTTFDAFNQVAALDLERPPGPFPPVFAHRIWVPYFEMTTPFFIADQCFFGHHADLMKLCTFDSYREVEGIHAPPPNLGTTHNATDAAPEILRWITPFLPHFPILRHYLDVFHHVGYWTDRREKVLRFNLDQPMWWRWLALYYLILHQYFAVGLPWTGKAMLVRELTEAKVEGIMVWPKGEVQMGKFLPNLTEGLEKDWGHLICDKGEWVRRVLSRRLAWDDEYEDFPQRLAEALTRGDWRDDMKAYQHNLADLLSPPAPP